MGKELVIPDAVEEADAIFPGIAQEYTELNRMASRLLARRKTVDFERTVLLQCGVAWQHYNAILVLLANAYGVQSLIVCRTLFETVVGALYLLKHPNLHEDFLDYGKMAFYQRAVAAGLEHKVVAIKAECQAIEKRFRGKRGFDPWHRTSIKKMAEAVRLDVWYERFYPDACSAAHSDATMTLRPSSQGWRQSLKQFADDQEGDYVRYISLQLIGLLFYQANKTLELGHDEQAKSMYFLMVNRAKAAAMPN